MYKFEISDDKIFYNTIKTYPEYNLFIYQTKLYVNNRAPQTGSGGLSIYDINNHRVEGSKAERITGQLKVYPFIQAAGQRQDFRYRVPNPMVKTFSENLGYIGPNNFMATKGYGVFPQDGGNITGSYANNSPITRKLVTPTTSLTTGYFNIATGQTGTTTISLSSSINLTASSLQNVAKKYIIRSKHFQFNSAILNRNLLTSTINFVSIPKLYYGGSIKPGSVNLNYYITGSKIASCTDHRENGELLETTGSNSGSVVGIVFYNEGVIMLTSSTNLETGPIGGAKPANYGRIEYTPATAVSSSWLYFGTTMNDGTGSSATLSSASYDLSFRGTTYINTMTILASAPLGELNHSNNPTYKRKEGKTNSTGSVSYYSEQTNRIKNIVSSSYTSASFKKTTYISKVRVYDEDHNLIGIASLATPIRKEERDSYTFKLKLDI